MPLRDDGDDAHSEASTTACSTTRATRGNICAMCELARGGIVAQLPDTRENREKALRTQLPNWPIIMGSVMGTDTISAIVCQACKNILDDKIVIDDEDSLFQDALRRSAAEASGSSAGAESSDVSKQTFHAAVEADDARLQEALRRSLADDQQEEAENAQLQEALRQSAVEFAQEDEQRLMDDAMRTLLIADDDTDTSL
jgi:hypothetical protein